MEPPPPETACARNCRVFGDCVLRVAGEDLQEQSRAEGVCQFVETTPSVVASCEAQCDAALEEAAEARQDAEACLACVSEILAGSCGASTRQCHDLCRQFDDLFDEIGSQQFFDALSCWAGPSGVAPEVCRTPQMPLRFAPESESNESYTGAATVVGMSPLWLLTSRGSTLAFELSGVQTRWLAEGSQLEVEFSQDCESFCETALVLRQAGDLRVALWNWARPAAPDALGVAVAYEVSQCASTTAGCTSWISARIVAGDAAIEPGHSSVVDAYLIVNGHSHVNFASQCLDAPRGQWVGAVIKQ